MKKKNSNENIYINIFFAPSLRLRCVANDVLNWRTRSYNLACIAFNCFFSSSSRWYFRHRLDASRNMLTFGARSLSFRLGIWYFNSSNKFFRPMRRCRSMSLCKLRFSIVSLSSMSMSAPEAFGIRAVDDDEDDAIDADDDLIGDVRGFLPRKRLILLLPFVVDVIVVVGVPSRLCCLFRDAAVLLF